MILSIRECEIALCCGPKTCGRLEGESAYTDTLKRISDAGGSDLAAALDICFIDFCDRVGTTRPRVCVGPDCMGWRPCGMKEIGIRGTTIEIGYCGLAGPGRDIETGELFRPTGEDCGECSLTNN